MGRDRGTHLGEPGRATAPAPGKPARAILARAEEIRHLAERAVNCLDRSDAAAKSAYAAARTAAINERIARLQLKELKESTEGRLRLGALEAAGIRTVADFRQRGRYMQIAGVGDRTISQIDGAIAALGRALTESYRLRIDADRKPDEHATLLAALRRLDVSKQHLAPLQDELVSTFVELDDALRVAARTRSRFRMLFTGSERRAAAEAALAKIATSIAQPETDVLEQAASEALAAATTDPSAAVDLWEDYRERAVKLNGLLIEVGGGPVDSGASHGFLPEDVVGRVSAQDLDLGLMRASLRGYQAFASRFCLAQRTVIVGDEMGLGKTLEALAVIAHLHAQGLSRFLVVCPASVLANWQHEVERHSDLKTIRIHGMDRLHNGRRWLAQGGIAVTTFEGLTHVPSDLGAPIDALIVDEAHYIKNPYAQRSKRVREWISRSDRTVLLTGTPMENRVEEFRALVGYLRPDIAQGLKPHLGLAGSDQFRTAVGPVYLRRNQVDVLDELPDRINNEDWLDLNATDEARYREAVAEGNFMAMRRASSAVPGSAKMERLLDIVEESVANDRKVVVFSYFLDVLGAVTEALGNLAVGPISGAVPPATRQAIVDDFTKRPTPGVLVAQIKAGGVGLNIQTASVVILTEPQWTPTTEEQAIARCHRMGQVRTVNVHRLLAEDSVDQRIREVIEGKVALFDEFARPSSIKEAAPEAVDVSGVEPTREVASRLHREQRIIEVERVRLNIPVNEPEPPSVEPAPAVP